MHTLPKKIALLYITAEGVVAAISEVGDRADAIPPEEQAARMTGAFAEGLPELLDDLLSHKAVKLLVNSYFMSLADAALSDEPRESIAEAMQNIQEVFAGGMIHLLKGKNAEDGWKRSKSI